MYCSQCGREAKPGTRFCAGCGAPLGKAKSVPGAVDDISREAGLSTESVPEQERSQQAQKLKSKSTTETATKLRLTGTAQPKAEIHEKRARKAPKTLFWLSVFGAITVVMAGIGGYLYLARPVDETPEVAQEPVSTGSSPSSAESSASQEIADVQQPNTRKENLQEEDVTQVLSLAEEKLLEAKRRAEESPPLKRGAQKKARKANDRGLTYLQSGQILEAISAFQEAYRVDPADVEIVNNLGYAYLLNNDLDSAERYVLTALAMQPGRSAGWDNLGQIYAKKGQIPTAVASFTNAYRFSRDLNKTHSYFLGLMKKENDVNLRQALQQATQIGERKFLSAGTNLDIKSKN